MTDGLKEKTVWESNVQPKRRRWLRKRLIILYVFLGAAIGLSVFVYRVMYAEPVRAIDYRPQLIQLTREAQGMPPNAENGWLVLRGLVERVEAVDGEVRSAADWGGTTPYVDVTTLYDPTAKLLGHGETREQVRALSMQFLEQFKSAGIVAEMDRMRRIPFAVRIPTEERLLDYQLPEIGKARYLARASVARMFLAHERGDQLERLEAFEQCLAVARIESRQASLLEYLVGIAITSLALQELRTELVERPPSEQECLAFLSVLDGVGMPSPRVAFEGERLLVLDTVQSVFTDDGHGDGRLLLTRLNVLAMGGEQTPPTSGLGYWLQFKASNLAGLFMPGRKRNVEVINSFFDSIVKQSVMSPAERAADPFDPLAAVNEVKTAMPFPGIMLPAISKVLQSTDRARMEIVATRLMLNIEAHRARTGALPADLDTLSASAPAAVSLDPLTGRVFGYRRLEPSECPRGRTYLIYSIGADLEDNAGREKKNEVQALFFKNGRGFDYVLNRPRPRPMPPAAAEEP